MTGAESTLRRLAGGVSGQGAVRVMAVAQSIVLVPVLISAWDLRVYGAWLAVTALGSFVGLTNFGLSNASGNAMILAIGAGDQERADRVFSTTLTVLAGISLPLIAALGLFGYFAPLEGWLNLTDVSHLSIAYLLLAVVLQVWLNTFKGVFAAAISATGRYGLPSFIMAGAKFLEITGIVCAVLFFGGGIVAAASILIAAALLDLVCHIVMTGRLVPWAVYRPGRTDLQLFRGLVKPSLGNVILHAGVNAVVTQGPRVIISILLGPAAVAVFAVHATAVRLADQATSLIAGPLQVEVTHAVGGSRLDRAMSLIAAGTQISAMLSLGAILVLAVAGPILFGYWSLGRIVFDYQLFVFLAVAIIATSIGKISLITVIGANRIFVPSLLLLPATATAMAIGAWFTQVYGVYGMGAGWMIAEIATSCIVIGAASNVLARSLPAYVIQMFNLTESKRQVLQLASRYRHLIGRQ